METVPGESGVNYELTLGKPVTPVKSTLPFSSIITLQEKPM